MKSSFNNTDFFNNAAQGTIEYLVILAVIVVVSLVVVSLMMNSTAPAQGVSETQSQIYWQSQPISIVEAVADETGDAIITLKPQENITLKSIVVDEQVLEVPETRIVAGSTQPVLIEASIQCSGSSSSRTITSINYVTDDGLSKSFSGSVQLVFECIPEVSSENISSGDYIEHKLYPDTSEGRIGWALLNGASGINDSERFLFDLDYGGHIDSNTGKVWLPGEAFDKNTYQCYSTYCENLVMCADGTFPEIDINNFSREYSVIEDIFSTCVFEPPSCNIIASGNCDNNGGVLFDDWATASYGEMLNLKYDIPTHFYFEIFSGLSYLSDMQPYGNDPLNLFWATDWKLISYSNNIPGGGSGGYMGCDPFISNYTKSTTPLLYTCQR